VPCVATGKPDAQKKTLRASEQDPDARTAWRAHAQTLDASQFVFLDECGSNIALTPRYARAPRGARAHGHAPRNWGTNVTLLATLTPAGIGPSLVVEGATNTQVFETYISELVVPALQPGQIVVLDNLSVHKSSTVREAIEACGCQVLFLPSYSPDFTPIEQAFSKLKQFLRRVGARTKDTLFEAIGHGLDAITADDARNWFAHCSYEVEAHLL
jgi:transposase